jgi:hypothetical protein
VAETRASATENHLLASTANLKLFKRFPFGHIHLGRQSQRFVNLVARAEWHPIAAADAHDGRRRAAGRKESNANE